MFWLIDDCVDHIIFNMSQRLRQGGDTRKGRLGAAPAAFLSYRRNALNWVSSARSPVCLLRFQGFPAFRLTALRTH
jgi:hypothetical protein